MDRIDNLLSAAAKRPLVPAVKHALKFARASINKYYSKTDASDIYRIAMDEANYHYTCHLSQANQYYKVLHPKLKLQYFEERNWLRAWIVTAREMVEERFRNYKEPQPTSVSLYND